MRDPRLNKLADVLVHYSAQVKPDQLVRINGNLIGMPLIDAIFEKVVDAGAHPLLRISSEQAQEYFLSKAGESQLTFENPLMLDEVEKIDASIGLWADSNTKAMSNIDPRKQALASKARKPYFDRFMTRAAAVDAPAQYPDEKPLRWVGTQYPTEGSAQDAEMSLRDYCEFVFGAGLLHLPDPAAAWQETKVKQQRVADFLTGKKELHFQAANGTDLKVNVDGMTWVNCCGESNFPDGEVFTGPNLEAEDGGVNGYVRYSFPAVHHGRECDGIELWFEKGRVVKAKAEKGEAFLKQMLEQDEGAGTLGEIAVGTNYSITRYTKNTLFDEKIGGTFHAAVGEGYPETGNCNKSALHWDMVCDLRKTASGGGGTITVDGEVMSKDGRFVFDDWPGN